MQYIEAKIEVERLLGEGWTRVGIQEIHPELWRVYTAGPPQEDFRSEGENYSKKLERREREAGRKMKEDGFKLNARAQELLKSSEVKSYREAVEVAMNEDPRVARGYLQGLGV